MPTDTCAPNPCGWQDDEAQDEHAISHWENEGGLLLGTEEEWHDVLCEAQPA